LHTNGNCKKAAALLSISYKSMLNKVKEYQLV
jgi:DNA-binding protein Fis